jgi:hypothetical protein
MPADQGFFYACRLRTTIRTMGRPPDGPVARTVPVTTKFSKAEQASLDRQRALRGFADRSAYIRSLVKADGHRLGTQKSKGSPDASA